MNKRNLNKELEYLANINFLGNEFFNQENYLDNICCNLGIELDILKDYRNGIHYIQEKLCNESLYRKEPNRQRLLTKKIEIDLFRYLFEYDFAKHIQYKYKVNKGFVFINRKYCPIIMNRNEELQFGTVSFLYYNMFNLIAKDYWEIPLSYTNPQKRKSINYLNLYEIDDDISLIKL